MPSAKEIRESVSESYAKAVNTPALKSGESQESGGSDDCCTTVEQKGVAVKTAGYTKEELGELPSNAVENSFGCGNPLAFSEVQEGDVVLDLGSGAGIDLLIARKKVGHSGAVIGVDMTDAMIERAKANIEEAGYHNIDVRKGFIEELPVESNIVDWVISNCVINLSPEKDKVFAEIARVLKPGGRISVSDIVVENLPEFIRNDKRVYNSCIGGAISESDYVAGLQKAGLENVEVTDRFYYDTTHLAGIVESELPGDSCSSDGCGCGVNLTKEEITQLSESVKGKIWSARFTAQKPV